jgi:hypothetical protein
MAEWIPPGGAPSKRPGLANRLSRGSGVSASPRRVPRTTNLAARAAAARFIQPGPGRPKAAEDEKNSQITPTRQAPQPRTDHVAAQVTRAKPGRMPWRRYTRCTRGRGLVALPAYSGRVARACPGLWCWPESCAFRRGPSAVVHNAVDFHDARFPDYRGDDAVNHALLNGGAEFTFTARGRGRHGGLWGRGVPGRISRGARPAEPHARAPSPGGGGRGRFPRPPLRPGVARHGRLLPRSAGAPRAGPLLSILQESIRQVG